MRRVLQALSLVAIFAVVGCYHAVIETGRNPATTVIEKPWAPSFIGGLVPPQPLETGQRCPNGIARVDTQLSFLNMVVGAITFGIFTPMDLKVTCAAAGGDNDASLATVRVDGNPRAALLQAIELSRATGQAVYAQF